MVTVLKHPEHLGVRYQPAAIGSYSFRDARFDFLPGVLMHRLGTCASLPVLFVAIGRRLGWPLSLAVAQRHVFCQWTKPDGTHLNLEGSCPGGGECYPDERYMRWPAKITAEELASRRYLRPLTNAESFALFLETRGHCLVDNQRFDEASEAYKLAYRVAPRWSQYENHMWSLELHRRANRAARFSMNSV